jgi:hypothetical protein
MCSLSAQLKCSASVSPLRTSQQHYRTMRGLIADAQQLSVASMRARVVLFRP